MARSSALIAFVTSAFVSGCALDASEHISEADGALSTSNALTANALTVNALFPTALAPNALADSALRLDDMTEGARAAIQDPSPAGDLSRKLLRYSVGCALDASQAFVFSWTDGQGVTHDERYPGALGVQTSWAAAPLSPAGQRIVSACLAARTNYYGIMVPISARSPVEPLRTIDDDELAAFPHVEGAFWGNVFAETPFLNACFDAANVASSRAHLRECAAGHANGDGTVSPCGIIRLTGDCAAVCAPIDPAGGYYGSCLDGPNASGPATPHVITIALP